VDLQAQELLLSRCSSAVKLVTGATPAPCSLSTDANLPLSLGIPATTIGLYLGAGEHTREEYVRLDSLSPGLEIALSLILPSFE
jgi:acetylornithine deacetylase/succinyl-diaminopimelate desuccinylase-like protein